MKTTQIQRAILDKGLDKVTSLIQDENETILIKGMTGTKPFKVSIKSAKYPTRKQCRKVHKSKNGFYMMKEYFYNEYIKPLEIAI